MKKYGKLIAPGKLAFWEQGGGYTNTGSAVIIADHNGYPKQAIEVYTTGELACGKHALIPVEVGDVIITVDRHRDRIAVTIRRITLIDDVGIGGETCEDLICVDAIEAAIAKSYDYHCRKPYYIKGL